MPRNRMMDYMMMDSARGGRRMGRRMGRRDRGQHYRGEDYARGRDYGYDYRMDNGEYGSMDGNYQYSQQDGARGRRDYESGRQYDMGYDYADMRRRDGHYPMNEGRTYFPIEAMGTFNGYYGMPEDYARGGRGRDYGYDYAGDYGETLSKQELEHWTKKLMKEVDEKDYKFFEKENIAQKAKQMGIQFDKFSEEELAVTALMIYSDYYKTLGSSNMDLYIRLAKDWLCDEDAEVQYGEKLAVYYDCIASED